MLKMRLGGCGNGKTTKEMGTQTDLEFSRIPEDDFFTNKIDSNVFSSTQFNQDMEIKIGDSEFEIDSNNKPTLASVKK